MAVAEERRRVTSRLVVLQVAIVVVFAALATSFWVLQIVQGQKYVEMAENNHQGTLSGGRIGTGAHPADRRPPSDGADLPADRHRRGRDARAGGGAVSA